MRTLPIRALTLFALALPAPAVLAQKMTLPAAAGNQWPDKIAGKAMREWIKELKSTDPSVVENALRTLPLFGPEAKRAVPDIVDVLARAWDISPRVNAALVLMFVEIRPGDKPAAVRALMKRVTDDSQTNVRFHAALTLGRFTYDEAKEAIPSLISASKDRGSWEIRKAAINSLGHVAVDRKGKTGPDQRATQALLSLGGYHGIHDPVAKVRIEAVMALGSMGIPANAMTKAMVLRELIGRLSDRDKRVVIWAHVGLMALDQVAGVQLNAIAKFLKTGDVEARTHAARALGVMGAKSKPKIPDLISALRDPEAAVVGTACWAFGHIGSELDPGDDAVAALGEVSKRANLDPSVKQQALTAIEIIKGRAQEKKDARP